MFITEEIEGTGDKGSGDSTVTDVESLMEASLKMSLRYTCFIDKRFCDVKTKVLVLELLPSSAILSGFLYYWTCYSSNFGLYEYKGKKHNIHLL